ncbi:immunoglobulin kappa light chain-like [Hoplias malabaricus]|uniref:immunoglobulin kappa light chain-like n=1 Tax=Hoplias malabaricus TaxID=27720 RepID=UPI003461B835
MALIIIFILALLNCIKESSAEATIAQSPSVVLVEAGQDVVINCKTSLHIGRLSDGDCKSCAHWYYQRSGSIPKVLIKSIKTRQSDTPSRFTGGGSEHGTEFTLTISGVQTEDSGDYYCQSYFWINSKGTHVLFVSLWYTFGGGTRLDVGKTTTPALTVLPPSTEELSREHRATVTCFAQKGFPSDWTLGWKVNGKSRGQQTSPGVLQQDGLYSWGSTLTLTQQEWERGDSVQCEATRSGQSALAEASRVQCV